MNLPAVHLACASHGPPGLNWSAPNALFGAEVEAPPSCRLRRLNNPPVADLRRSGGWSAHGLFHVPPVHHPVFAAGPRVEPALPLEPPA